MTQYLKAQHIAETMSTRTLIKRFAWHGNLWRPPCCGRPRTSKRCSRCTYVNGEGYSRNLYLVQNCRVLRENWQM